MMDFLALLCFAFFLSFFSSFKFVQRWAFRIQIKKQGRKSKEKEGEGRRRKEKEGKGRKRKAPK